MEPNRGVTLQTLARVALFLRRVRALFWLLALLAGIGFVVVLLSRDLPSQWGLVALSVALWAVLALGTGYALARAPAPVNPTDGLWRRMVHRAAAVLYSLCFAAMLGLAALALYLSFQALGIR